MNLDTLMQKVVALDDSERRQLLAYLVALQESACSRQTSGDEHHELDSLIGTWKEDAAFDTAQRAFERSDEPGTGIAKGKLTAGERMRQTQGED